jgi:hypothetical protein
MVCRLVKRLRVRAAFVLAVLYSLCVIVPPLALAFTDGSAAAHCMTDDHHGMPHVHGSKHFDHEGGSVGNSSDHDKGKSENCCGLFCVTAGAVPSVPALTEPDRTIAMNVVLAGFLGGRATDRIDRPPRLPLSL